MLDGFAPLVAAASLVWALVRFGKQVLARDGRAAATQIVVWGAGVAVAFLLSASDFADGIQVAGVALGSLNAASLLLVGLTIGSTASTAYEVKKALDSGDDAREPRPTLRAEP